MFAVLIGIGFTLLGNFFPCRDSEADGSGCGYPVDRNGISADCDAVFAIFYCELYLYCVCKNDNAPNIAMAATLLSSLFNIVFDYVFMFPMHMGMRGAALATGVSPIISIGICMIHYLSKKNTIVFKWHLPSFRLLASAASLA